MSASVSDRRVLDRRRTLGDVVTQRLLGALHGSLQTDEYARAAMQVGGRASRG